MAVPSSSRRSAAFDNGIGVCAEQFDSERFKTSGDMYNFGGTRPEHKK